MANKGKSNVERREKNPPLKGRQRMGSRDCGLSPLADRALYCLDRAGRGPSLATGEVHPSQTYQTGQLVPPSR
jgi:hypothetical protein